MPRWVILLRGINVGGKHRLPMADLKNYLLAIGAKNVSTYIQSGNAIVEADSKTAKVMSHQLTEHIEHEHGFRPFVMVIAASQFKKMIAQNPFPQAANDPKSLHFFFLTTPTKSVDQAKLVELCSPTEQFLLAEQVFYLYAPDGIGRSKLAEKADKLLGVATTARNLNTIVQLATMLDS